MNLVLFLFFQYQWFTKEYESALIMEKRAISVLKGENNNEDTLTNPFYFFYKSLKLEEKGLLTESDRMFRKCLELIGERWGYLFLLYRIAYEKNLKNREEEIENRLLFLKEKYSIDDIEIISYYFYEKALHAPDPKTRSLFFKKSLLFSPHFYVAPLKKMEISIKELNFSEFFQAFSEFNRSLLSSPFYSGIFYIILIRLFFLGFSFFLLFFVAGKLLKYNKFEFFSATFLKNKFILPFPFLLILFIILIPWGIPPPFFLFFLVPIYPFFSLREKVFTILISTFVALSFVFAKIETALLSHFSPYSPYLVMHKLKKLPFSRDGIVFLDALNNEYAENMKGILFYRDRQFETARKIFRTLLQKSEKPEYYINIGNTFFMQEKYDSSEKYYRKAIELDRKNLQAHFNLAQVAFKTFDLSLYGREIEIAQSLEYEKTVERTRKIKEYGTWEVMESFPKKMNLPGFHSTNLGFLNSVYFLPFGSLAALLILSLFIWLWPRKIKATRCCVCYRGTFEEFHLKEFPVLCKKCHQQLTITLSTRLQERIAKKIQIEEKEKKRNIILVLNSFFPGIGFSYNGNDLLSLITFFYIYTSAFFSIVLKFPLLFVFFYLFYLIFVFLYHYFVEVRIGS